MTCETHKLEDGFAIVCTRSRRRKPCSTGCGRTHTRLCDHPAGRGTCDAPLCESCAVSTGPDRDVCPAHARGQAIQGGLPGCSRA